ncbi:MAG: MASE3 domain-containing protein [Clostridiaceae bacterium]
MEYFKAGKKERRVGTVISYLGLLMILIIGLCYVGLGYYTTFHIGVELFSSFIALSVFIIAINSYEISKNIPFLFLGTAYGVSGVFNIIHLLTSNGMGFFQGDTTNLSLILSLIPRFISIVAIFICYRLLRKTNKLINHFTIFLGFSMIFIWIFLLVFYYEKFPACYIPGIGLTTFKITAEYVIVAIAFINLVILFKAKEHIDCYVFLLMQLFLYSTIIGSVLLNFYSVQEEITNVLAHVFKVITSYCIYRSIVKVALKNPYKILFNELHRKNKSLKLKDAELNETVDQLKTENQLRRKLEDILIKNEVCNKLLIKNLQDTIIIYDNDGIIFTNEGAARLVGISYFKNLIGEAVTKFFPFNSELQVLERIKEQGDDISITSTYETQITSINGKVTQVKVVSACFIYQDKPTILSLVKDISQNKQIEKMKKDIERDKKILNDTLEFNGLIKEFFSNISHELRTPLNVIMSGLQVLKLEEQNNLNEKSSDKRNRYFGVMKQNCYRLLRLINNLIDISKIDSGYLKLNLKNENIVAIVEDITLSIAEYIQNNGVEVIFDTDVEEKVISCDPDSIERIIMNLLSNSVKFTTVGDKITVDIVDQGETVKIIVKDTGIGIPKEKLKVIFERFRQVDNSLSRNSEGSGIGLSLVKALVEMHGGSVDVKSTLGEGTEFIIILPARKIDLIDFVEENITYQSNTEKINIEFSDIYK